MSKDILKSNNYREEATALVLSKAVCRAADQLELSKDLLAQVLGVDTSKVEQMYAGEYILSQPQAEWELAEQFIRGFLSLIAIVGDVEPAKQSIKSGATIKVAAVRDRALARKASRARSGMGAAVSVLDAMDAYRKQVTASPEASAAFLTQLGVLDEKGNLLTLCS